MEQSEVGKRIIIKRLASSVGEVKILRRSMKMKMQRKVTAKIMENVVSTPVP